MLWDFIKTSWTHYNVFTLHRHVERQRGVSNLISFLSLMSGVCLCLRWLNWSWILSALECVSPGGNISWWPPAEHPVVLTRAYHLHMPFPHHHHQYSCQASFQASDLNLPTERDRWDVTMCHKHTRRLCCKLNKSIPLPCGLETSARQPAMMDFSCVFPSDDLQYNLARSLRILWENNSGFQTRASNTATTPLKTFLWQKSATAHTWQTLLFEDPLTRNVHVEKCSFHKETRAFFFIKPNHCHYKQKLHTACRAVTQQLQM